MLSLVDLEGIDLSKVSDVYPVSYLQMGMLLESSLDNKGTYHDVFNYIIDEAFDEGQFKLIWSSLLEKHEMLRARVFLTNKGWVNVILKEAEIEYYVYEEFDSNELILNERSNEYNFEKDGLFRLLVNRTDSKFELMFSFHHALADGWSVASLINEFVQAYCFNKVVVNNNTLHYGEFVRAEQRYLKSKVHQGFWNKYLGDFESDLPKWKFSESKSLTSLFSTSFELDQVDAAAVLDFANDVGVSVDNIFLYTYFLTLSKLLNKYDIVVGLVVNNRIEKAGGDELFGLFLNTIPFRCKLRKI